MSSYPRHIREKVNDIVTKHWFKVMRVWSKKLNCSISFLPSFVTPYKHYGSHIIWTNLRQYYCDTYESVYECAKLNNMSYSTFSNWLFDFKKNKKVHLTLGLERLGIPLSEITKTSGNSPPLTQEESLIQYYDEVLCEKLKLKSETSEIFSYIQKKFSHNIAPIGFFRASLKRK